MQRADGSWLVDGAVSLGDFYATVGVDEPERDDAGGYHTVAGLVIAHLRRLPTAGDRAVVGPLTLEVADMDGFRVDKILVIKTGTHLPGGRA